MLRPDDTLDESSCFHSQAASLIWKMRLYSIRLGWWRLTWRDLFAVPLSLEVRGNHSDGYIERQRLKRIW